MQNSGLVFDLKYRPGRYCLSLLLLALVLWLSLHSTADTPKNDPPEWSRTPERPKVEERDIFGHSKDEYYNYCVVDVGFGPLRLKSQSPFQSLRMGITPLAPSTIIKGEWEFFLAGTLANTWANESDYQLDFETLNSQLSIAYGITQTIKLEVGYEDRRTTCGSLDDVVIGFHDAFQIEQNGRDETNRGNTTIEIQDQEGDTVFYGTGDGGVYTRGLSLTLQQNVTCGTKYFPAFSYALHLRQELEYPNILDRGNPYDFGISAGVSRRSGDLFFYLSGGYIWFGNDSVGNITLNDTQLSGMFAAEWRFVPTQSLVFQILATEAQTEDLGPFSESSYEVMLGWKWEVKTKVVLEFALIENIIVFDNSPDFGIHAGITSRF